MTYVKVTQGQVAKGIASRLRLKHVESNGSPWFLFVAKGIASRLRLKLNDMLMNDGLFLQVAKGIASRLRLKHVQF